MKISSKIYLLQLLGVAMMGIVVAFTLFKMDLIGTELEAIANDDIPLIESISAITVAQLEQDIAMERALRAGDISDTHGIETIKKMQSQFSTLNKKIDEKLLKTEELTKHAITIAQNDKALQKYNAITEKLKEIKNKHKAYQQHMDSIFKSIMSGDKASAEKIAPDVEAEAKQLSLALESLLIEIEKFTEQSAHVAAEHEVEAITGIIVIALVSMVAGITLGFWIANGIRRSINNTNSTIREIAETRNIALTIEEGSDELGEMGRNFNFMMQQMSTSLNEVSEAATQLAASSEELSAITNQARDGLTQQSSETHQVATAMHEMTASMHEVAQNATQVAESVTQAINESKQSGEIVELTVKSINSLATEIKSSSTVIKQLAEDTVNINSVLDVIKGIAEQTNLLALNAAIEAARAGEQGRGFAVVADEVRVLAHRTQEATTEIQTTIEGLQAKANDAVNAMTESQNTAENGVGHAEQAGSSLTKIVNSINAIGDMTHQIATASEEQSSVSTEINRSITTIKDSSEEINQGAEHTAKASYDIAELATELQTSVSRFTFRSDLSFSLNK